MRCRSAGRRGSFCWQPDGERRRGRRLQRASGELAVSLKQRGTHSVIDGLRQVGCLKARFPRPDDAAWLHVVTLNTSGGVAGGDVLDAGGP